MECKPFSSLFPVLFLISSLKFKMCLSTPKHHLLSKHFSHFFQLIKFGFCTYLYALQGFIAEVAGSWLGRDTVPPPSHFLPQPSCKKKNRILFWHFQQESLRLYQSNTHFTTHCSSKLRKIPHRHCIRPSMEGINCESTQQIWEVVSISCRTLVREEKTCREKEEEEIQSVFGLYMLEGCKNYTGGSRQQFQSLHKMIQHIKTKSTCWMLPL